MQQLNQSWQPGEKRFFGTESVKYREFFVVKSARYIVPSHGEAARFEFFTGQLGVIYYRGIVVAQDYKQAATWFRKAAAQGNASAQNNLGWMYANGQGVAWDDRQAVMWWQKAAARGNAMAQSNLGIMYINGRGVARDPNKAVMWFRKAAAQGNWQAKEFLSEMGLQ